MNDQIQKKINILILNDEGADLEYYRDLIVRNCNDTINVQVFGPDEAGSKEVAREFLKIATDSLETNKIIIDELDVIFVDYRMPDMNGILFLHLLRKLSLNYLSTVPVVLMTKYESQLLNKLDAGIEEGLSGYIFTDRDLFWLDVEATAFRVYQDKQRERWAESLMKISSKLSNVFSKEKLCQLFINKMYENCPRVKVFIREYNKKTKELKLLSASPNVPTRFQNSLKIIDYKKFSMLGKALEGQVYWYNSLNELEKSKPGKQEFDTCKELGLHRGMSFPVKDGKEDVFATISMYRQMIDPPFTVLEKNYAELMINQISETWILRQHKQQGEAYTLFFKKFTGCEDENLLFKKLVQHLHSEINNDYSKDILSKTTFKILYPGTDKLICQLDKGHHIGQPRNSDFSPSIFSKKSISAWVARKNRPRIVSDYHTENDYTSTNSNMRSELCCPVSSNSSGAEPVIGVLNMECSKKNYYIEEDLDYAETLCRLTGSYIDRLRAADFLKEIISSLAHCTTREELIDKSIEIIKKFTGYRLLLFVIRDAPKWKIAKIDVDKENIDKKKMVREIQKLLAAHSEKTLLQKAFSHEKPIYYVPNLHVLPQDNFYVPDNILHENEKLRSQAVFLMKSGDEVVGGLSLDFVITNALSQKQQDLLGHFACWLGRLILQDKTFKHLHEKIEYLDKIVLFTDFMSKIRHKSEGHLHSLRNIVEDCFQNKKLKKCPELYDNLKELQTGIEQIKGFPTRIKDLAKKPDITTVNVKSAWETITSELSDKIKHFDVQINVPQHIPNVMADENILKMILYHLLDNALDACENSSKREITLSHKILSESRVEICITDTGKKITDNDIKKMLTLAYTTKPHGSGYGLTWVKQKVIEMGGIFLPRPKKRQPGFEAVITLNKT